MRCKGVTLESVTLESLLARNAKRVRRRPNIRRMAHIAQLRSLRLVLQLSQEEFAERYEIPIGTLRDWEQGRATPDQPARAYLKLIQREPEHVYRTLNYVAKKRVISS